MIYKPETNILPFPMLKRYAVYDVETDQIMDIYTNEENARLSMESLNCLACGNIFAVKVIFVRRRRGA